MHLRFRSRFAVETLEHSMTLRAEEERENHAWAPRMRVGTFSPRFSHTDFTKRTRSSVYIYTYTRSYILLRLSFHPRNTFATRSDVSLSLS